MFLWKILSNFVKGVKPGKRSPKKIIFLFYTHFIKSLTERILKESDSAQDPKVKFILEELPNICEGINTGVARIKKILTVRLELTFQMNEPHKFICLNQ